MTKKELVAAMKKYIAKNKQSEAIDLGMNNAPNRGFYDSLVLLSGRLQFIKEGVRRGIFDQSEEAQQKARVSSDLINLINDLGFKEEIPHNPLYISEIIKWPTLRTQRLVESAQKLLDWGLPDIIRQRAAFSSFSLPSIDPERSSEAWDACFYEHYDVSRHYYHLLWREQSQLKTHAKEAGCKLLLSPNIWYFGEPQRKQRLKYLLKFVDSVLHSGAPCEIVLEDTNSRENTTLIGKLLLVKSHSATTGGFKDTLFNADHKVVSYDLMEFDMQFKNALKKMAITYEWPLKVDEDYDGAVLLARDQSLKIIKTLISA